MQKLLPRFFNNGDDPDVVREDTIARDDDGNDVKILFFLFYSKTGDFLQIGRRCMEKRAFNKANMKIFQLHYFSLLQIRSNLFSCDNCGKTFLLVYYYFEFFR